MADDVGVLVARVVADTEQFRSDMFRVSNQMASNTAKMNASLAKLQASAGSVSKVFDGMTGALGKLGIAFSVGAIVQFGLNAIKTADAIGEAAAAANIGAERFQRLQLVFAENGVDAGEFAIAMNKLNVGLGNFIQTGAGPAAKAIKDLGLESAILSGKISTQEQFIDAVADALSKMGDRSRASAIAVELLGKGGAKLAPVMIQGADALHKAEAAQSGVFSDDQVAKADALERAYRRVATTISVTLQGAFVDLASAVAGSTPEDVARRAEIGQLQFRLKLLPPEGQQNSVEQDRRVAIEQKLRPLLAAEYRAQALLKSQIFDDQVQQQAQREIATAQRVAEEAAKAGAKGQRSASYANLLFDNANKDLDQLRDNALQEVTVTAEKQQAMLSMEQQIQADINAAREATLQRDIERGLAGLNAERKFNQEKRDLAIDTSAAIEYAAESLMQLSQGHNKRLFELSKKLAIASTIVNTAQAIMKAYAELGPIGGSVAAVVLASTGLLQLQRIRSTQFDSGGGSVSAGPSVSASAGSPSSASSAASTDLRQHSQKVVNVYLQGDIFGWDDYATKMIIPAIRDAVDGQDVVIIGGNSRQAALLGAGG